MMLAPEHYKMNLCVFAVWNYVLFLEYSFRWFVCPINSSKHNGYLLLSFNQFLTESFEPFDRCEAQLVTEESWIAEAQNWSISVIENIVRAQQEPECRQ